jgi:hypothetical protein
VKTFGQRLTRHEFHHEIENTAGLFESVNSSDVGIVQRREQLCLTAKSIDAVMIVREGFGENLDRDVAFEMLIACGVDLAHSAFVECGEDLADPVSARSRPRLPGYGPPSRGAFTGHASARSPRPSRRAVKADETSPKLASTHAASGGGPASPKAG